VTVIWTLLSFALAVLVAALGELVSDEIRARLDSVPFALLTAAARRLPPNQRSDMHEQAWLPELHHILRGDHAVPITRLIHGIRFAIGLWLAAPRISRELGGTSARQEQDAVTSLDSRLNLLTLRPIELEHLIRQLFMKIGMRLWVTQASRDSGVDAVAVSEQPIVGGLWVIQVKRYSMAVGVDALRTLAGAMEDKRATKGILITTSWVSKAGRDFAARNGRIEIIDGQQLKSMLLEHLPSVL
jgi:hypothetical protein